MDEIPFIKGNPMIQVSSANVRVIRPEDTKYETHISEEEEAKLRFIILPTLQSNLKSFPETNSSVQNETTPSVPKKQRGLQKYLGILLTLLAAMFFSSSAVIIKLLNYHPFNLGVWRFFVMILIPIPFLCHALFWKKQPVFKPLWPISPTLFYLAIQAIVGSNSMVLFFYGLQKLNVADSTVICTSAPVFVTVLAYVFLKEKCGVFPIVTAILTLIGVVIISRPPILTGAASMDETSMIGAILSFGSMLCLATCYVVIRYLRTVHHALVNLCFALCGFCESLVVGLAIDVLEYPASFQDVILILSSAFLAFSAQTCLTLALKYEQAGPVSLVRTSEVIFSFLLQIVLLGINPDIFSLIGAFIVISAVVLAALRKILTGLPDGHRSKRIFWILLI